MFGDDMAKRTRWGERVGGELSKATWRSFGGQKKNNL